jgi:hypothetical protein
MKFLKFGLIIHMVMAIFMLTNPDIVNTFQEPEKTPSIGFDPV